MNLETYSRGQVARFCIDEAAHYGGVTYMLCIACIIRNRVFAGWGTWLDVVLDAPSKRGSEPPKQQLDLRSSNIRVFLQKIDEVCSAADTEDLTNGALFYTDVNQPQSEWFTENILKQQADEHRRVGQAQPLLFFL